MPETRFGELTIAFDGRVLAPRDWTRQQAEWVAEVAAAVPGGTILELCSGAGQIGLLTLTLVRRAGDDRQLVCVDVNPAAHELTLANAATAGLAAHVDVRCADLDAALSADERFPLVIADPPWVPRAETDRFPKDPLLAIDGGDDGLEVARGCVGVIGRHLAPGGAAVLQLGYEDQVLALSSMLEENGLRVVEVRPGDRGVLVRLASRAG